MTYEINSLINSLADLEALQVTNEKNRQVAVVDCGDDVWQWRYNGWCMTGSDCVSSADEVFAYRPLRVVYLAPRHLTLSRDDMQVILTTLRGRWATRGLDLVTKIEEALG